MTIGSSTTSAAELVQWVRTHLAGADTAAVRRLRDALLDLERAEGVGEAHRLAGEFLRGRMRLVHGAPHTEDLTAFAVSPCGTYLATGADSGDDYDRGAEIAVWDLRTGQVVQVVDGVRGGVGRGTTPGQLRWSDDGEALYAGYDTNGIGRLEVFSADSAAGMATARLTDGWGHPPAWVLGPGGELAALVYSDDSAEIVACARLHDADVEPDGCEWLDNRVPEEVRDHAAAAEQDGGEDDDGADDDAYAIDTLYSGARIWWPTPDRILVHNGDDLLAFDRPSRRLLWRFRVGEPVALSSGAEYVAHHPAGIAFYDGADGLPTDWLPMHVGASALVFTSAPGDGAPPRMAAVIEADNRYGTEVGVHVYDDGEFVCGPDLVPARCLDDREFPVLAWSPDGARFACLTADEAVEVWRLDGRGAGVTAVREHVLDGMPADGATWPQPDRLVLVGEEGLVVVDPLAGRTVARRPSGPGSAEPDPATDVLPTTRRAAVAGRWVVLDKRTVIAPPEAVPHLGEQIDWAVDRRVSWPLRWTPPTVQSPAPAAPPVPTA